MGNGNSIGDTAISYVIGKHPGAVLLPPRDITIYDSLPMTVRNQIYDGDSYDYYGKLGFAYDQDTMIQAPTGKAKIDYENWLVENPQIALEIDQKIRANMLKLGMITPEEDELPATVPTDQIEKDVQDNMRPDKPDHTDVRDIDTT